MAGGEFRFGTASIYMAQRDNIQPNRTSQMRVITWTRFRRPQRHFLSTSAAFIVSARGKLGLGSADRERWNELRQRLDHRRQARILRTRFRRDPDAYLAELEQKAYQLTLPT